MTPVHHASGYARPWVVAPGARLALHADLPEATEVSVVRLACANGERHPDGRPWGPPARIDPVATLGRLPGVRQSLRPGTQLAAGCGGLPAWDALALVLAVRRLGGGRGGSVLSVTGSGGALHVDMHVGADDRALLRLGFEPGEARATVPLPGLDWLLVTLDLQAGFARLRHATVRAHLPDGMPTEWAGSERVAVEPPPGAPRELRIGRRGDSDLTADLRIDLVSVVRGEHVDRLSPRDLLTAGAAGWEADLRSDACLLRAQLGQGRSTVDLTGQAQIVETQRPTIGVPGVRWSGVCHDPRQQPEQFSALQLHADALLDAHWASSLEWQVPAGLPSGAYAFRLDQGTGAPVHASFFVSGATRPRSRLALWLPTFSYLAYGNTVESMRGPRVTEVAHVDEQRLDALHPAHGRSLYERHGDAQGVLWAGSRRPLWSVAPGHRPWQFPADSWLADWLERRNLTFDVITDHDVHRLGAAALSPYAVVLTGHHPEYVSEAAWDGLFRWLGAGGRLMYLGGNGFYWRTAVDEVDDLIEVRRAEDGTRPFIGAVGESHHAFDGAYGGLWRRLGRPPQQILGVGMAAQGFDHAAPYRKAADAARPEMAWVFEGITGDVFGAQGCWGGGASGWEIDRADRELGTPTDSWWLARSEGHASSMLRTKEELLSFVEPFRDAKARSDMVISPMGRGHVFAVGSMTWIGALWTPAGEATDVSRITANVLQRFLDPTPLPAKR